MELEDVYYHVRFPAKPKDFWELNQEMSYVTPFADFKKTKNSAKIMCAIYMIYDPKSQLNNSGLSQVEVKEDISVNFLGSKDFDWSKVSNIVRSYQQYCKTRIEKELDKWYLAIKERMQTADDLDWEDDFDIKEKIVSTHKKYIEDYNEVLASLKEERQEKLMYGDYTPSLLESWHLIQ